MEAVFYLYVTGLKWTRKDPSAVTSTKTDVIECFQTLSLRRAILSKSKDFTNCEIRNRIVCL